MVDEEQNLTKSQSKDANDLDAIPDGGIRAWLQVLGSFFLFLNTWGIINSFGAFQTYYQIELLASSSTSAISWVGSIQLFLLLIVGSLTGPIYDAGYFRTLIISGTALIVFGTMMLSLSTQLYQVLLAQAICIGIGCGCLFIPSVAILSTYFSSRIALVVGLAASGSSVGAIIYPILWHRLQLSIGFGWATRVLGFFILGTLLIPITVMKVRVLPEKCRGIFDVKALRQGAYTVFIAGSLIGFMGLYAPFIFVQLYDISKHISEPSLVFYYLPIINAGSIFGRTLPSLFADKVGPFNVMVPFAFISGVLCFCLIAVDSSGAMIVFCILYGFFSGTFVSLPPAIFVSLSPNRNVIGTYMGMGFSVIAVGVLIGIPAAGAIHDTYGFTHVWIFSGVLTMSGAAIIFIARCLKVDWAMRIKC